MGNKIDRDGTDRNIFREKTEPEAKRKSAEDGESALDDFNSLSLPERGWLEWFYLLSDADQKFVEACGEMNIAVTPENFDEVKRIVDEQDAAESPSAE